MTVPKDINGLVSDPQQVSLISKLLSKSAQVAGGSAFQMLLNESLTQLGNQSASRYNAEAFLNTYGSPKVETGSDGMFKYILATVLKHEGSAYVQKDGSESSKYGILQSTAKEFGYHGNVKNLSRHQAEAIYRKIWDKSGAASLPYPLSLVHFDTYVNSPAAAVKLLGKSGGNADKYLAMRAQRYTRLAELRPDRYGRYLKGWMNRIADLRNITGEHAVLSRFAKNDTLKDDGTGNTVLKA